MTEQFGCATSSELLSRLFTNPNREKVLLSSKLSLLCDRIIEAGWLTAVITAPLFFNGYTSTVMQADKLAVLRSIACVMAAAWLVKWIGQRGAARPQTAMSLRSPLVLPTLILTGVYLLTTFTSLVPRISFFGGYRRPDGVSALLTYVILFAMILQGLRTRQQLDRLIVTIILASLPVAIYSIIQKYQLDPLAWSKDFGERVGASLGNPIFMAAYMIMAFSLTLGRIVDNLLSVRVEKKPGTQSAAILSTISYILIAVIQSAAIIFSASRGPWLGWFAGVVLFILLLALVFRQQRLVLCAVGLGLVGLVLLLVMNLPNTPLEKLREIPGIGRLGRLEDGTAGFRLYTWDNVARLVSPHAPLQFPDGTPDSLNIIRPLVGYGSDSLSLIYRQLSSPDPYSPTLATDHSHNETWDVLVTTGVIGLVAYQLLWLSIFMFGLRWLGLMPTNRERDLFIGMWIGLGLVGGLGAIVLAQPKYLGLTVPAGNMAGIILYLVIFALKVNRYGQEIARSHADRILLAALLSGLLAHYVEIQFGINLITTRVPFWTFAAMIVVVGASLVRLADPTPVLAKPKSVAPPTSIPDWAGTASSYALVIAVILSTLLFEFVTYQKDLANPLLVAWQSLSFNPVLGATAYAILALLLVAWILSTVLVLSEMARAGIFGSLGSWWKGLILVATFSLGLAFAFGIGLGTLVGALGDVPQPAANVQNALDLADRTVGIVNYYAFGLCALILLTAVVLVLDSKPLPSAWFSNKRSLAALVPAVLVTYLGIDAFSLTPTRADIFYRFGKFFEDQAEWDTAIALYKRAIYLAPTADPYYMALGTVFWEKAAQSQVAAAARFSDRSQLKDILELGAQQTAELSRVDLLYASQTMLIRARDLNPLYVPHSMNLALFYLPELPVNSPSKLKLADLSNQYYAQAARLNPNDALLWNEWANFDLEYRNDLDGALQKLDTSLGINPRSEETHLRLGKVYVAKKDFDRAITAYEKALALKPDFVDAYFALGDLYKEQQDLERAAQIYQEALVRAPSATKALSKLAFVYYRQGKIPEAIQTYSRYIEIAPDDPNLWEAYKNLVLLYRQRGDLPSALHHAEMATWLAPHDLQGQLNEMATQLRSQIAAP